MPGLIDFAHWFLKQPIEPFIANPVEIRDCGYIMSVVIYREPPFQVEHATVAPFDRALRDHRHPDIDAYEVALDCPVVPPFIINDKLATNLPEFLPYLAVRVNSTDWHRVDKMESAVSFLSIQEWLGGTKLTSVGMNWEGIPISDKHKQFLLTKDARWKKTIRKKNSLTDEMDRTTLSADQRGDI
jgi:hypothetical protein